ncbi:glycosyl transferase [Oceaniovalibus guishaninsula JLT2003]|uniref:Glycosyl transferase n=1 Tax=Oceaniovalibus guishaninsula JLT2003 TaxID=1231392 RepID=K2GQD1_9RHOB|nr:glycosyltransferase family 2 protein [Oceaniovalibus guishaninsula]EKE44876.1 glycosyl transferase [Oceaniovalibus guishaninsula JLT2003]
MTGLSAVIPVWNDFDGLLALLDDMKALACFDEVVIVDDSSFPPVQHRLAAHPETVKGLRVVQLRNAQQRGAGYARNRGLRHVTADRVVFLDSDDRLLDEFGYLAADLAQEPGDAFDLCLFAHVDSRVASGGGWGPLPDDAELWRKAGIHGLLGPLPRAMLPQIIQIAAYPWNKVYRTGFLREQGIGCTELLVHNDIELHWRSLIRADRMLVSDRMAVYHYVRDGAGRLTNRRGAERAEVTRALAPVAWDVARLAPDLAPAFARFAVRLFDWGLDTLEPEFRQIFLDRARAFLAGAFDERAFAAIAEAEPEIAARILDHLEAARCQPA